MTGRPAQAEGVLDSPVRRQIVEHLAMLAAEHTETGVLPAADAHELAKVCGLHVTTVRFHLDRLIASGLIETRFERGDTAGRPRKLYAVPSGRLQPVSSAAAYQMLVQLLMDSIGESELAIDPEALGRRWARRRAQERTDRADQPSADQARSPGAWLGKVGYLIDLLIEWGYTPNLRTEEEGRDIEMTIYDCPFLPIAADHAEVVCGMHKGLLQGTLEAIGESQTTVSLHPRVTSRTCAAHLTTHAPFTRRSVELTGPDPAQSGEMT